MADYGRARANMVDSQLRTNRVADPRVLAAMGEIPREDFVPASLAGLAYVDEDLPLGGGRYLVEPMILARLLQALEVRPDDVALDVGCGCGYSSAVLGRLASAVVALEEDEPLRAEATRVLAEQGVENVVVVGGRLVDGYPDQAPYDVILVAGAVPELPDALAAQLAEGGRLATVVDAGGPSQATLAVKSGGTVSHRALFDAHTPPLPGFAKAPGFVF